MRQIKADLTDIQADLVVAIIKLRRHANVHPALEAIMPDFESIATRLQALPERAAAALQSATAEGVKQGIAQAETDNTDAYNKLDAATTALEGQFPAAVAPAAEAAENDSPPAAAGDDSLGGGGA